MAEPQQGHTHAAAFPAPPPFFKYFTAENLSRLKDQRENTQCAVDNSPTNQAELENLPHELQYLVPPIPPDDGRYWNFGDRYNVRYSGSNIYGIGRI